MSHLKCVLAAFIHVQLYSCSVLLHVLMHAFVCLISVIKQFIFCFIQFYVNKADRKLYLDFLSVCGYNYYYH